MTAMSEIRASATKTVPVDNAAIETGVELLSIGPVAIIRQRNCRRKVAIICFVDDRLHPNRVDKML
jgi:hypothetical protein